MSQIQDICNFIEYGKNGEAIPEAWDYSEIDKKYPYILEIVKVSWQHGNEKVELDIDENCKSATILPDRTGVLILQSCEKYGPDNAIIMNADGTLRFRLNNPFSRNPHRKPTSEYSFGGSTIENGRLALIVGVCTKHEDGITICGDWIYQLDTDTGTFLSYRAMGR